MSKPARSRKESGDYAVNAFRIVAQATGMEPPKSSKPVKPLAPKKNRAAVALGRLGGKKGGFARAKALTPKRRHEIAMKAARARWGMADDE
jgi:hypothetical protein